MPIDPKDIEIHDLRNALMSSQNQLAFLLIDLSKIRNMLREILEQHQPENTRTAGGR